MKEDRKKEAAIITREEEQAVIKYLLDIMKKYDIITEFEYQTVFCKLYKEEIYG